MKPKTTKNKSILQSLTRLGSWVPRRIKRLWLFPYILAEALGQRRRQAALEAAEAERLDRIRNPSDYLGK